MPAGVGYAKKRTVYKKKNTYARKTKSKNGAYDGIERKFLDTTKTSTAMSNTWASILPSSPTDIDCLSVPVQGVGESEHLGRTYFINAIFVKGFVARDAVEQQTAPLGDLQWRILLVWDMQTNGTAITATDVMDDGATNDVLAYRNLQHSSRFIVLGDTGLMNFPVFNMNEGGFNAFANPASDMPWTLNKTFKKAIKVRTDNTTGVVESVTDNSLSLIGITSNVVAKVQFESRMRFSEETEE